MRHVLLLCLASLVVACSSSAVDELMTGDPSMDPDDGLGSDQVGVCELSPEETEVLALTNAERDARGLLPLTCDPALSDAALSHAIDMCEGNYFSHDSQDGREVDDRVRESGGSFQRILENIAWGQRSAEQVNTSWMTSDGHRENILSPTVQWIGIGYTPCAGRPLWVQVFGG